MSFKSVIVDLDSMTSPEVERAVDLLMEFTTSSFSEVEVMVNGTRRRAVEVMIYYLDPEDDETIEWKEPDIVSDIMSVGLAVLENAEVIKS